MLRTCATCGKTYLWFRVKQRWHISPIGKMQSNSIICTKCDNNMKKMFGQMTAN